jgi:hypothetical protein
MANPKTRPAPLEFPREPELPAACFAQLPGAAFIDKLKFRGTLGKRESSPTLHFRLPVVAVKLVTNGR